MDERPTVRAAVRLSFLAVGAISLLNAASLATRRVEIYPAPALPGFPGSAGFVAGEVEVERLEVEITTPTGDTLVSPREFLGNFPTSHHRQMSQALRPDAPRSLCEPRTRRWLAEQAGRVAAGTVTAVEFRWVRDVVRSDAGGAVVRRTPAGSRRVTLAPGTPCDG